MKSTTVGVFFFFIFSSLFFFMWTDEASAAAPINLPFHSPQSAIIWENTHIQYTSLTQCKSVGGDCFDYTCNHTTLQGLWGCPTHTDKEYCIWYFPLDVVMILHYIWFKLLKIRCLMSNNLQIAMGNIKVFVIAAMSFWCSYMHLMYIWEHLGKKVITCLTYM